MNARESKVNFISGMCIAAFGLAVIFWLIPTQIREVEAPWFNSPRLFPYAIGILLTGLGLWLGLQGLWQMKKIPADQQTYYKTTGHQFMMVGVTLGTMILYCVALKFIGYIPSTIVLLAWLMFFSGQRNWIKIAIVAIVLPLVIYFAFSKLLLLRMP